MPSYIITFSLGVVTCRQCELLLPLFSNSQCSPMMASLWPLTSWRNTIPKDQTLQIMSYLPSTPSSITYPSTPCLSLVQSYLLTPLSLTPFCPYHIFPLQLTYHICAPSHLVINFHLHRRPCAPPIFLQGIIRVHFPYTPSRFYFHHLESWVN